MLLSGHHSDSGKVPEYEKGHVVEKKSVLDNFVFQVDQAIDQDRT